MKFILMIIMLAVSAGSYAQTISFDAVASDGGYYSNTSGSLSFSAGEVMAGSVSNGNLMLCQGFQQTYFTYWVGNVNTNWSNPLNWNGGPVPDLNIDLVLLPGRLQYPVINTNVACRSLLTLPGATITVQNGSNLTVTH